MSGSKAIFTAVAGADSRAVFNLNGALGATVFGATRFEFNLGSAASLHLITAHDQRHRRLPISWWQRRDPLANAAVEPTGHQPECERFGGTILATNAAFRTPAPTSRLGDRERPHGTGNQIHLYSFHPAMWAVAPTGA